MWFTAKIEFTILPLYCKTASSSRFARLSRNRPAELPIHKHLVRSAERLTLRGKSILLARLLMARLDIPLGTCQVSTHRHT